jgi:hypothetical protein
MSTRAFIARVSRLLCAAAAATSLAACMAETGDTEDDLSTPQGAAAPALAVEHAREPAAVAKPTPARPAEASDVEAASAEADIVKAGDVEAADAEDMDSVGDLAPVLHAPREHAGPSLQRESAHIDDFFDPPPSPWNQPKPIH